MGELQTKLGTLLRLERERQRVRLEDLAEKLKIAQASLEAIERGDEAALPSNLYFNLFAKSYAEALGIDYTRTVDAIKEDIGLSLEPEGPPGKKPRSRPQSKGEPGDVPQKPDDDRPTPAGGLGKVVLWGFLGLVILFVVLLIINQLFFSSETLSPQTEPPFARAPQEVATAAAKGEDPASTFATYDWNVPLYQPPPDIQLRLSARSESWATIVADGDTAIFYSLFPGRTYDVTAEYRMLISIAIPTAVDVECNGRKVDLTDPNTGRISRVSVNQVNIDSVLVPSAANQPAGRMTTPELMVDHQEAPNDAP